MCCEDIFIIYGVAMHATKIQADFLYFPKPNVLLLDVQIFQLQTLLMSPTLMSPVG